MNRRQVLAATTGLLAGAGCVGVLGDETTWGDIESLWVVFENRGEVESRVTVSLGGADFQSDPVTVPAGDSYDWAYGLSDASGEGEPTVSIQSQAGKRAIHKIVHLDDADCQTIRVRAVLADGEMDVERECDQGAAERDSRSGRCDRIQRPR